MAVLPRHLNGKCHINYRDAANPASACHNRDGDKPGKYWVRLMRRGSTFTAFTRFPDGIGTWKHVKELELPIWLPCTWGWR